MAKYPKLKIPLPVEDYPVPDEAPTNMARGWLMSLWQALKPLVTFTFIDDPTTPCIDCYIREGYDSSACLSSGIFAVDSDAYSDSPDQGWWVCTFMMFTSPADDNVPTLLHCYSDDFQGKHVGFSAKMTQVIKHIQAYSGKPLPNPRVKKALEVLTAAPPDPREEAEANLLMDIQAGKYG